MVEVRLKKSLAFVLVFLLLSQIPMVSAERYVADEPGMGYAVYMREVVSTRDVEYFLIDGTKDMELQINLQVYGTNLNNAPVRASLVQGNYTLPDGETEPELYDRAHSMDEAGTSFRTDMFLTHTTQYTLVVVPEGNTSYEIEIMGDGQMSSFGTAWHTCLVGGLAILAGFLAYLKIHGVIGRPRPVRFRKREAKENREIKEEDSPYRVK